MRENSHFIDGNLQGITRYGIHHVKSLNLRKWFGELRYNVLKTKRTPIVVVQKMLLDNLESSVLIRRKRNLRKQLLAVPHLMEKRVAILGGSTTGEVRDMLELHLLDSGIRPLFYESGFNRFFEEATFDNPELSEFSPEIIYLHTSVRNINRFPSPTESGERIAVSLLSEYDRFASVWASLKQKYDCPIIQNNFDMPAFRTFGNLDCVAAQGSVAFVSELNRKISNYAAQTKNFLVNDIHYLSSVFGLAAWHDEAAWFSYKYAFSVPAIVSATRSVAAIIRALSGKSRKCLVLDLDNTLWGGSIGETGVNGIEIGFETPTGEAFAAFQRYCQRLQERGILIAICSKNDENVARTGFAHPAMVLKTAQISAFRANWSPKHENLVSIADELNIGLDSMVFVDDAPMERELVRSQLPDVAVPELGDSVTGFIASIERGGYFETIAISDEDKNRTAYFQSEMAREKAKAKFNSYEDFLFSLNLTAEISCFTSVYIDRIAQLINKTNQFNLTNKRLSTSDVEQMMNDRSQITLYVKFSDKFGEHGLVSVLSGRMTGKDLEIELWLMSCRVLNRGVEFCLFDELVSVCQEKGLSSITGTYFRSPRNEMVSEFYSRLGFTQVGEKAEASTQWRFIIPKEYKPRNHLIRVLKPKNVVPSKVG